MDREKLIKLQHFFESDVAIKREIYELAPIMIKYTDEESMIKYINKLDDSLRYIFTELKCVAVDIFGEDSSVLRKIYEIEKKTRGAFAVSGTEISRLRLFYENYVSRLEPSFVEQVKDECYGYSAGIISVPRNARTINEILHYMHSYVVNNEKILQSIPEIGKTKSSSEEPVSLRGERNEVFEQLFSQFPNELYVGKTDMVIINDKKLIMMVRDRGHALTFEVSLKKDGKAKVEYFIPKIINVEMINSLPGIYPKVKEDSIAAVGKFEVPIEALASSLYDFISKVPTDYDRPFESFNDVVARA